MQNSSLQPSESQATLQQEAGQFVQAALDALSAHVAILDESGEIISVNRAWRSFGRENGYKDPQQGVGVNYLAVCDAAAQRKSQDATYVAQGIRSIIRGALSEFQLEYLCHGPKAKRWFVVRISRFDWQQQMRLIVAHQNVTELKHIQVELSESKGRLEAILDNVNNAILTINRKTFIETANRATTRIFGYTSDDITGMPLGTLMQEVVTNAALDQWSDGDSHELVGIRSDGTQFPIAFASNQMVLNGESYYTCIIQDITNNKRMEAALIERERMEVALQKERELWVLKNRFLSMMGHELSTPLTSISLSYDMLKKYQHIATPEENEQALDNIQQQVGYLREMISDVMTLSRSDASELTIDPEEADLITYCRDVVEEFQFAYHRTHQVEFECEERDVRAQIDRRMLRRVFTNLLSNAVKYSPKGDRVLFRLSVDIDRDLAIIDVEDHGIGIPEEDLPRLYEPFHRAGNVDSFPGTGLGLAIVKQIVDQHGGNIAVETQQNIGTTFSIELPLHHHDLKHPSDY